MKKFLLLALMMVGISVSAQKFSTVSFYMEPVGLINIDNVKLDWEFTDSLITYSELSFKVDSYDVKKNGFNSVHTWIAEGGAVRFQLMKRIVLPGVSNNRMMGDKYDDYTHVLTQTHKDSFSGEVTSISYHLRLDTGDMKVLSPEKFSWYLVDAGTGNGWSYLHVQWGSKDCYATIALFDSEGNFVEKLNVRLDFGVGKTLVLNPRVARVAKSAKIKCDF